MTQTVRISLAGADEVADDDLHRQPRGQPEQQHQVTIGGLGNVVFQLGQFGQCVQPQLGFQLALGFLAGIDACHGARQRFNGLGQQHLKGLVVQGAEPLKVFVLLADLLAQRQKRFQPLRLNGFSGRAVQRNQFLLNAAFNQVDLVQLGIANCTRLAFCIQGSQQQQGCCDQQANRKLTQLPNKLGPDRRWSVVFKRAGRVRFLFGH